MSQPPVRPTLNRAVFRNDPSYDYSKHPSVIIGHMERIDPFCAALRFMNEPAGMCCVGGMVRLLPLSPPPEPLSSLLSGESPDSVHFLRNVRKYSAFQVTSFEASKTFNEEYMSTFKIQGQIYHRLGSLLPSLKETANFSKSIGYFPGIRLQPLSKMAASEDPPSV